MKEGEEVRRRGWEGGYGEGRRMGGEGRGGKREEGRGKREEGRGKREEGRGKILKTGLWCGDFLIVV